MKGRSDLLDGLRAVAVLPVLGYHFGARAFGGGWLGVDVFFVISGYVVTRSLLRRVDSGRWSTQEYFLRRSARLLPVVIAAGIVVLLITLINPDTTIPWLDLAGLATITYNGALELPGIDGDHLRHMWSLAVEWHFYVVLPLLVPLLRRTSKTFIIMLLIVAIVTVALARVAAVVAHPRPFFVYTLTPFRVDGMLLGSVIALAPTNLRARVPAWLSSASLVVLLVLLTIPQRWGDSVLLSMGLLVVMANVATAVIVTVEDQGSSPNWMQRTLSSAPVLWIGKRSYSLYVWHFIIGSGLFSPGDETFQGLPIFALQVAASMLAAALSYRLIELPAQRFFELRINRRFTRPEPRWPAETTLSRS